MRYTRNPYDPTFSTETTIRLRQFIENLVAFYVIMEGIFFYSGFVMMLSFHRRNLMTGVETMDLAKEQNFFETGVTEYQSGGMVC